MVNTKKKDSYFKQLTLKLKGYSHQVEGMIIEYIKEYPQQNEALVLELLKAHLLPYTLKVSSTRSRDIARDCAISLEAAAMAIRQMYDLSPNSCTFSKRNLSEAMEKTINKASANSPELKIDSGGINTEPKIREKEMFSYTEGQLLSKKNRSRELGI